MRICQSIKLKPVWLTRNRKSLPLAARDREFRSACIYENQTGSKPLRGKTKARDRPAGFKPQRVDQHVLGQIGGGVWG